MRISFMNEIANLCELVGADVDNVRKGIGSDRRIGPRFLFPGVGYGGSCFPKDVQALGKTAQEYNYDFRILNSVMSVNYKQRYALADKMKDFYGAELKGKKIALWGLAFKPNTDDIREAPAIYTIDELLKAGAEVVAYDPEAMENIARMYGNRIKLVEDQYGALEGADALAIVTEWSVFRTPDFEAMANQMRSKVIFDGRNLYHLETMEETGWYYASIGRRTVYKK
jgi:UDPglucose 6-dehydrogenase